MVIGFTLAYLIDRKFRGHAFWTTIILIPMMLSPAVVGNFWRFLYEPQIGLFAYAVSFLTGLQPGDIQMLGNVSLAPWSIIIVDTWMWTPYVMLICLAGLRSIPDYIYEAAEVDRASAFRQFWSITLPMALPFIMLAVLFRGIENFKMFDMVTLLTGGGPGSITEVASITLKRQAFESWLTGRASAFAIVLFVAVFGLANIYVKALNRPSVNSKRIAGAIVILYALITMVPLVWIFLTSIKSPPDSISYPPKLMFTPTLEGYCNLFSTRTRQTPDYIASLGAPKGTCDEVTRKRNMVIAGPSNFLPRFVNSLVIAFGSTFLAVFLGTLAAYGFSRFKVPLADDLLFFILSTRFMSPAAGAERWFRDAVLDLASRAEFARPMVNSGRLSTPCTYPLVSAPDVAAMPLRSRPGSVAPDAPLGRDWLLSLLGGQMTLLAIGTEPPQVDGLRSIAIEPDDVLRARYLGASPSGLYLVRPDQIVAARWETSDAPSIKAVSNLDAADDAYALLIAAHKGLTDAESTALNA
eukprot:gene33550-44923_t